MVGRPGRPLGALQTDARHPHSLHSHSSFALTESPTALSRTARTANNDVHLTRFRDSKRTRQKRWLTPRELIACLDELLDPAAFDDLGPNGLQVPGRAEVERVVTGVTAQRALFERAVEERGAARARPPRAVLELRRRSG